MSTIEGKVANQPIIQNYFHKPKCGRCCKLIDCPSESTLHTRTNNHTEKEEMFVVYEYIRQPYYIYETKSGFAVCYCSDWCRKKHNHRFKK